MRASTALLVNVKPLPASSFASIRLPPTATARVARSGTQPLSKGNPQQAKAQNDRTVAQQLAKKATDAAAHADASWPSNLRIEEHVNNKDLYWKVSKAQRDILRKQLREA
ncbi:uncharacterized protein PFL1_01647 [Pseudozyma flocculosa PF-1]|uniref:Uncharacterized protein n=1 Tax=Pseudozyma flocculosa TaxID=84751 RepID=A0A5C3EXF1_9BASI|nr:uncharacterized protein PFL1_01647 [Pseudozyma flocculosa PF-1]EPQ30746.1 hypothetical protein PFL1_01647 [Pseudozyma flocculosa PF-1]SPO36898.1 uncharacterized protein PSFLO_02369 [Pseudozyma flocculosa]